MEFLLGFLSGLVVLTAIAVWLDQRTKAHAASHPRQKEINALQSLLKAEAKDGLTTAQAVELNGLLKRLQQAPIQQARKDVH